MVDDQIIDTPVEIDVRDLDRVAGGIGGDIIYNRGNIVQSGDMNVAQLNGNNMPSGFGESNAFPTGINVTITI